MAGNALLKRFDVAIDLKRPVSIRPFEVVEGDTGNRLTVTLTDDGQPVDMTGLFIMAVFSNSNGISVQDTDEGSVTADGNALTIDLAPSSFAPGMVECELQLYSHNDAQRSGTAREEILVTSAKFNFSCRRAILNGESIETTAQFPILTQTIEAVEAAEAERDAAEAARAAAEVQRASAEAERAANEAERVIAELRRQTAETARAAAERDRESNEMHASIAEAARASAETARQAAETARASSENERQAAEAARASAETARQTAETARAAAEAERVQAMAQFLEDSGIGVKVISTEPTLRTQGERGRIVLVQSTGRAFICTAVHNSGTVPTYTWKEISYINEWQTVNDITLSSDCDSIDISEDASGGFFFYGEIRVTIMGSLASGTAVRVSVNDDDEHYAVFSNFMHAASENVSDPVTVLTLLQPSNEVVILEAFRGGTSGGAATAEEVQKCAFYSEESFDYYSFRISSPTGARIFRSGTRVIVEGRRGV